MNIKMKKIAAVMIAMFSMAFVSACGKEIKIDAASAFFPMGERVVNAVFDEDYVKNHVVINQVATFDGFSNISTGNADLLISSIPNEEQSQQMAKSGKNFEVIPFKTEPLVVFVNKDNPVDSISIEEFRELYKNESTNWKAYGGDDLMVNTYQLEEGNGSQTAFSQYVAGTVISQYHHEIKTMPEIISIVGDDKSGIGYAFKSYYIDMYSSINTKPLKIDGKSADEHDYPLTCEVSLYYCKDKSKTDIKKIIDYIMSDEGQKTIKTGSLENIDYEALAANSK